MRTYWISGVFYPGLEWEDFLPEQGDGPRVAMTVEPAAVLPDAVMSITHAGDRWFDVAVRELTEETARFALSVINHCEPKDVTITCRGTCPAV